MDSGECSCYRLPRQRTERSQHPLSSVRYPVPTNTTDHPGRIFELQHRDLSSAITFLFSAPAS